MDKNYGFKVMVDSEIMADYLGLEKVSGGVIQEKHASFSVGVLTSTIHFDSTHSI
jgi:hypothetical protein